MDPVEITEDRLLQQLATEPDNADVLLRLGWLRLQARDWVGAREVLLHAHVLQPRSAIVRIYAAHALAACHDDRAAQMLVDWRDWLPLPDQQQLDLALALEQTDWSADAVGVLQDLLARSPGDRWARISLASLYERVNQTGAAGVIVDAMLKDDAHNDVAMRIELQQQQAALLKRKGDFGAARTVLERAGPRTVDDTDHYFELAQLADRQGDEAAAMRYLERAHAIQHTELERVAPQRLDASRSVFSEVHRRLTASDVDRWPQLVAPSAQQSPIFVVGFPRSGTTLVEQMLDAHPALQSMDERPYFTILADQLEDYGTPVPQALDQLTQADCDELRKGYLMLACARTARRWGAQLVDKNPLNLLRLPLIHRMFPSARFVLLLRDPRDVLLSNYMQNYRSAVMMAACSNLVTLARAYTEAFEWWFEHAALLAPAVLTIHYEELVAHPAAQVARLGEYLELNQPEAMLGVAEHARAKGFIGTPSYSQVVEPIHQNAVGHWRRYRKWLERPVSIIAPLLPQVGYANPEIDDA